jgi:putative transposase
MVSGAILAVNAVAIKYIPNQEEHHRKRTFAEEYEALLREFEVEFDSRYLFKSPE